METKTGRYFSTNDYEKTGNFLDLAGRLRIIETDGFSVVMGGMNNKNGKLTGHNVIAHCDTKIEAEELINKLTSL